MAIQLNSSWAVLPQASATEWLCFSQQMYGLPCSHGIAIFIAMHICKRAPAHTHTHTTPLRPRLRDGTLSHLPHPLVKTSRTAISKSRQMKIDWLQVRTAKLHGKNQGYRWRKTGGKLPQQKKVNVNSDQKINSWLAEDKLF